MKRLGYTDIYTRGMGLGCCFSNPIDSPENIIKAAIMNGIKFFDTSKVYGTEEVIGKCFDGFKNYDRKEYFISTKTKSRHKALLEDDIEDSLKKLNTDYIDIYFLHSGLDSLTDYERIIELGSIDTIRNTKKVKYVGISGHSLRATEVAIFDGLVDIIMVPHNILYRNFEPLMRMAKEHGIGVITMKNFASGILLGGPDKILGDSLKTILKFEHYNDYVDLIIPSARSMAQVFENITFFEVIKSCGDKYSEEEIEGLVNSYKNRLGDVCVSCHQCRPCKKYGWSMSQPDILRALTYKKIFKLDDKAKDIYLKRKLNITDCTDDCSCNDLCPLSLDIKGLMTEAHKLLSEE